MFWYEHNKHKRIKLWLDLSHQVQKIRWKKFLAVKNDSDNFLIYHTPGACSAWMQLLQSKKTSTHYYDQALQRRSNPITLMTLQIRGFLLKNSSSPVNGGIQITWSMVEDWPTLKTMVQRFLRKASFQIDSLLRKVSIVLQEINLEAAWCCCLVTKRITIKFLNNRHHR